ncbi:MAG: peptidoglycan DD-metalloendopeptidase family protein [Rhizomicrobium sp.]
MSWRAFAGRDGTHGLFVAISVSLSLFAAASINPATAAAWPRPTYYSVVARPGDILPALSARYRVSAAAVAHLNRMGARSALRPGEALRIPASSAQTRSAVLADALDAGVANYAPPPLGFRNFVAKTPAKTLEKSALAPPTFAWPLRGDVIAPFGPAGDGERNDGINIATEMGMPIRAAASGTVTYAGNGPPHYGKLLLISHAGGFVSAYAHAHTLLVLRGDRVRKGEVIATAGETGGVDRPQLHFEIRSGMKPVDPQALLADSR